MNQAASLPSAVFKAYDIRGTVPDQLNAAFAQRLGQALAQRARNEGIPTLVVGYDGRYSSPELSTALQEGIMQGGVNTIDLGMVPTPLVYFGTHTQKTGSGIAITGSHNPPNYNGFKMMMGGKTLYGDDIQQLAAIMANPEPADGLKRGTRQVMNLLDAYVDEITRGVGLSRPMKIAIDCGNGVGGVVAKRLYGALGCRVDDLYCEVDGGFPNHHPDPADPHNLQDLIRHVQESDCELGLAFDGDADRLGVVTKSGQIIWPDRQLILYAQDVLQRQPGATIIFDVKCSRHVASCIEQAGGQPLMWQTGHSMIKAKLAETGAPLAGEMSGHIFFKERWYGFDDGLYTGARLLEILSRHDDPSAVLEALPQDISTPEIKLEMKEGEPHALIARLQKEARFPAATTLHTIDGVRAEYPSGFGLARASNTTPVIVLRFEADTEDDIELIKAEYRQALTALSPGIKLPF
ncbi:phosphomannomutase/phosphoglucomutase [Pollutimonas thiosulfatoxidans]|uniref:Phosphomannomutase/phosphoglucomutase n=1 Tax=Pollutimonas thiosulfatoxidans TaxID=2028345 RepID=A0A410G870_9BURK|nr:phosphomannomutase/phosphoglucomutase [Pollutimonas thiosulfatoxidans]QAA92497.1 phosphomannomutase/phosphoglucomutase [Pollutimonas thiosulfatoxidans]